MRGTLYKVIGGLLISRRSFSKKFELRLAGTTLPNAGLLQLNLFVMKDRFEIIVSHGGKQLSFPGQLIAYDYSYKIEVEVNGTKVFLEPDEERNWRALISYEDIEVNKNINKELPRQSHYLLKK